MTTDTEGLIEPRIIMRAGQCGKHQRALCGGCLAAWESNDHRIQTLEAEVERLSALQQPDERDAQIARLREAAAAFIAKFDECKPHIDEAFMHRQLRAGDYTGPQLGEELEALRAAIGRPQP